MISEKALKRFCAANPRFYWCLRGRDPHPAISVYLVRLNLTRVLNRVPVRDHTEPSTQTISMPSVHIKPFFDSRFLDRSRLEQNFPVVYTRRVGVY